MVHFGDKLKNYSRNKCHVTISHLALPFVHLNGDNKILWSPCGNPSCIVPTYELNWALSFCC